MPKNYKQLINDFLKQINEKSDSEDLTSSNNLKRYKTHTSQISKMTSKYSFSQKNEGQGGSP